jgi:glycosidase
MTSSLPRLRNLLSCLFVTFLLGGCVFMLCGVAAAWGRWGGLTVWGALCCALLLSVSADSPDINIVGVDGVKAWATARRDDAARGYAGGRLRSPAFWGSEIVYQIMIDRFNNGNLSNDNLNLPSNQMEYQNTSSPYDLDEYRHGGDLAGITQRLDYLVDLGITSLWITPTLKHNGAYHGYCTTDPTYIDPGFGTDDEFLLLVQEAHTRGIRVVLDIVVNHLCDADTFYSVTPKHYSCADDLNNEFWSGIPGGSQSQGVLQFSDNFFGPLKSPYFFSRCGPNSAADTSGQDPVAVYGDFVNVMFDYDTRNYDFQEIFTLLHQYWIAYADVDGFRMDAAKHITEDFIAYFATEVRAYARQLGKDNFFVVGEVAASADWEGRRLGVMFSDPNDPTVHGNVPVGLTNRILQLQPTYLADPAAPYPGLNAIYDFAASGTSKDVLLGNRPPSALSEYFASDSYNTISGQNDYRLNWVHLEIHDWPRFIHDQPTDPAKVEAGLSYLLTARGQPIVYYGLEQAFNGNCDTSNLNVGDAAAGIVQHCTADMDSCFRQDMFLFSPWRLNSALPQIDDLRYIGLWAAAQPLQWQRDPFLNRSHSVYQTARKLTHIRRSCRALTQGALYFRIAETQNGGLLAYSRIVDDEEVVVVINPGIFHRDLTTITIDSSINCGRAGGLYKNLLYLANVGKVVCTSSTATYLSFSGVTIAPNNFMIFSYEKMISPYDSYLQCNLCLN